ncbi:MAG: hypothetical protein C4293_15195, partial [Nitrospiraceae bacterium]
MLYPRPRQEQGDGDQDPPIENPAADGGPPSFPITDGDAYEQEHDHREHRRNHGVREASVPPYPFGFRRQRVPDLGPRVVRSEEDEAQPEESKRHIDDNRPFREQQKEADCKRSQDQQLS